MTNPPYIFDVGTDTFAEQVIDNSAKSPVLVIYWSPHVSLSLLLIPRLIQLTTQCAGRFQLALFNVDQSTPPEPDEALKNLPLVKLYRNREVIDIFEGDASDETLRTFLRKHVPLRSAGRLYAEAVKAYGIDNAEHGAQLATEAALMDPTDVRTPVDVAKLLVLAGRFEHAESLMDAMPQTVRDDVEIRNLRGHMNFIRVSQDAPSIGTLEYRITINPGDLDARYQLASCKVVRNDYESAMCQLLEITRRDPGYRNNAGQSSMLALFQMLGDDDDCVRRYRPLLTQALNEPAHHPHR